MTKIMQEEIKTKIFKLFKRKPLFLLSIISDHYNFTYNQIDEYKSIIDWTNFGLSGNKNLRWTLDFLKKYEHKWRWNILLRNEGIVWSSDKIEYLEYKITELKNNKSNLREVENKRQRQGLVDILESHVEKCRKNLESSIQIDKNYNNDENRSYEEFFERYGHITIAALSSRPYLSCSQDFLDKNIKKINWNRLSENRYFPWTIEYLLRYKNHWNWNSISANPSLPWSSKLIKRFMNEWKWDGMKGLSYNSGIQWDESMLEEFENFIDWEIISINNNVKFTFGLISKFDVKLNFDALSSPLRNNINWSFELLKKYRNKWNWKKLNYNKNLPWSIMLFNEFKDEIKWQSDGLSVNESIPWSEKIVDEFIDNFKWHGFNGLSQNPHLPLSIDFIEKYFNKWDWGYLALNKSIWDKVYKWHIDDEIIEELFSIVDYCTFNENGVINDVILK